ncbi:LYR motif-containing protein 9-like [Corticium candelabrum]|uniref:LYR motif-containing protein 9-like n=1 Tax=Corticium candelabrum TaxID=121492 RepID=UPI002E254D99|nr:LYR motif-containing protein 9-like [Corticium candelabrum]
MTSRLFPHLANHTVDRSPRKRHSHQNRIRSAVVIGLARKRLVPVYEIVMSSTALYRHLLRCVALLPKEVQPYYKHHVRQGFKSHEDEDDPERIEEIVMRSRQDAQWILNKYKREL